MVVLAVMVARDAFGGVERGGEPMRVAGIDMHEHVVSGTDGLIETRGHEGLLAGLLRGVDMLLVGVMGEPADADTGEHKQAGGDAVRDARCAGGLARTASDR